jgi:hypothetical protein
MTDVKVAEAEARQAAHQSAVSSKVEGRVNAEISGQAATSSPADEARVAEVASHLRSKALDETVHGERRVDQARAAARWSQFLDYAFYVVYALLGIRLVLALIAANSSSGFVVFIRMVTDPFYAPFRGIVASPSTEAGNTLVLPIGIALVVYVMLHLGLNGLLRMVGHRKTSV